jgi:hypothetical protein
MECLPIGYSPWWIKSFMDERETGIFSEFACVYESQDSASKIIDTLKFMSRVNILGESEEFFLVCTPSAKPGFIKKSDVYLHVSRSSGGQFTYFAGPVKYETRESNMVILKLSKRTSRGLLLINSLIRLLGISTPSYPFMIMPLSV